MDSIGLWLVKTVTVGVGVTSVPVTDAFSAQFDNYRIIYAGGSSSGASNIAVTLGASATGYNEGLIYNSYSAAAVNGVARATQANWQWCGQAGNSLDIGNSCAFDLYGPALAKHTYYKNALWAVANDNGWSSGAHKVATAFTDFTISAQSATTITGGTIRVYGYRN
jgi:hypothetical protein